MTKSAVSLEDKYVQLQGSIFLSSIQALVRLPLDQARRDRAGGLRTAGFISGYRGSPLGTYDAALWSAEALLRTHDITFLPGLNEELAASSVRGTQELDWFGEAKVQGVFGLWYGKGVGTDRAMEALKQANLEGASANGGVLVVTGDDHGGKSSTTAHQSEHTLIASMIPVLYPAGPREILEYGLLGWEMSRYSGLYIGLKCVTDLLDFSASIQLPDPNRNYQRPILPGISSGGLGPQHLRMGLDNDEWTINRRLPATQLFARANGVDRVIYDGPRRALSIVAAGKAYLDVCQALRYLDLDEERCATLGIRLYKPGLIWPLEPEGISAFCAGTREVLVVEEKRPVIEEQLTHLLYGMDAERRPAISGKRGPAGAPLLPSFGELSPAIVAAALIARLEELGLVDDVLREAAEDLAQQMKRAKDVRGGEHVRPPYFCSGCPHSTSTRLPDGSIAIAGTGCHTLAAFDPERRTVFAPMPMGGDGMAWVGASRYVDTPHIFQNIGDGTYVHSGILGIRGAVAAAANVTFKVLYNDAVAMTGGQPLEGHPTPPQIALQLLAEGVSPVVIVSDQPQAFTGDKSPPKGVTVRHRDDLDDVQRTLREQKGVSGLIYVQTCAAEMRRRRKRGTYPDPDKRVFINADVCEGCGDCSVQSNCLSVQPLETAFGRKRRIDQSSCNKDYSCTKGFCPSFVTVEGGRIAGAATAIVNCEVLSQALPEPSTAGQSTDYNILITGIGGTGVLTIGAIIGMAAHIEGRGCTVMDMTGLAQKGGAVTSHLRVFPNSAQPLAPRLDIGMTDLIIGCDMVVTSSQTVLKTAKPGGTVAVLNADITPTGDFQSNRDLTLDEAQIEATIREALGGGEIFLLRGTQLATIFMGDSIATNVVMMGYALQKGLLPVSLAALTEAIHLNGTNIEGNLRALNLGRLAAVRPEVINIEDPTTPTGPRLATLEGVLASRMALLADYQDNTYAQRYADFITEIGKRVATVLGGETFARAVALTLARLMAYKDEYEVARLLCAPRFVRDLSRQFRGDIRLTYHLAPPFLSGMDPRTGRPRKIPFGSWVIPLFRLLASLKCLRGTPFDVFGYTRERRTERALVREYEGLILSIVNRINATNLAKAVAVADAARDICGYGPVKDASIESYRKRLRGLMQSFERAGKQTSLHLETI